ncbi:MAG: phage portal protein [Deltaproteobacteria bacterium]|nr:phage portal protein [Deltaproteobacteria bacterium]
MRTLWGRSAGHAAKREVPYFPEATRLFFLSPHLLTELSSGRLNQPYREHVWVYACINAIAQSLSGVPLLFKTGPRKDPKVVESHPLVDLFDSPNPMMSGSQLIEATFIYLGLTGEACYIAERKSDREIPKELWVFHPHRFKEVLDERTGLISGWVYTKSVKKIPLQPHEVIFFRYFNPYHDYRGLAPLQAARAGVEQDFWASQYNTAFFKNSAQPGGVLETSGNLSDEEYQRVLAQWQDRHGGASKAHAIALLEGGLSYKQTGLSQKDMDFLEQRKWNREEIMAAFKVPKPELGLYEDVNFASAKTQRKIFWENTLLPKMALFEFVLWNQLCRHIEGGRLWAEFDYSSISALQEDRTDLVDSAQKLFQMGVPLNVANEYLGLGLPAIAGGDVGYLPFNLAPVGQAKPMSGKALSRHLMSMSQAGAAGSYPLPVVPARVIKGFDEEAYWRHYLAMHTPLEQLFQRKIKRFFYEQRKRQLRLMEKRLGRTVTRELSVEGLLLNSEEENGLLKQVIWPLYLEIGGEAGKMILVELGADPGLFNLPDTQAMAALESKLIKVVGINETVREQLRKTLLDGISQMETTAQLMDRVRQVYNFAQTRALTIARTETGQAAGIARDAAMNMLEVKKHRWVTAGDEHVRVSHQALNGVVVERGQLFPNGCHFPCDPYGPAKEIINCFIDHQVAIFTTEGWKPIGKIRVGDLVLTHRNRFRKVTRLSPSRIHSGEVVKLTPVGDCKRNKRSVVTTPEHRFLMADGSWRQAQHIRPGDRLKPAFRICSHI